MHPTGGSLRVFRHFVWLEAGSVKAALSRPAHQRVTQTVSRLDTQNLELLVLTLNMSKRSLQQSTEHERGEGYVEI